MMYEIDKVFEKMEENPNRNHYISSDMINEWMKSENIDVLGKLYVMLTEETFSRHITVNILSKSTEYLIPKYFIKCIVEDPEGEWVDSRYTAAIDSATWFKALCKKKPGKVKYLQEFIDMLAKIYLESNVEIKEAVINGFLEHVLCNKKLWFYFNDWKNNPELYKAFKCGINPRLPLPTKQKGSDPF